MPKVCLSNVASQYGIHLLALAPNLAPLWMSSMPGKKPALRSSREGSGGAAKAMPGAYDVSEKHSRPGPIHPHTVRHRRVIIDIQSVAAENL
jgi:hypothetical protein